MLSSYCPAPILEIAEETIKMVVHSSGCCQFEPEVNSCNACWLFIFNILKSLMNSINHCSFCFIICVEVAMISQVMPIYEDLTLCHMLVNFIFLILDKQIKTVKEILVIMCWYRQSDHWINLKFGTASTLFTSPSTSLKINTYVRVSVYYYTSSFICFSISTKPVFVKQ